MSASLHNIIVDCKRPAVLSAFYVELLGWETFPDSWDGIVSPQGVKMEFQPEEAYTPPVWPAQPTMQGQMMHLDFDVDDLAHSVALAKKLGATVAPVQFYEEYQCVTMFDPEGHPFCLLQKPAL